MRPSIYDVRSHQIIHFDTGLNEADAVLPQSVVFVQELFDALLLVVRNLVVTRYRLARCEAVHQEDLEKSEAASKNHLTSSMGQ